MEGPETRGTAELLGVRWATTAGVLGVLGAGAGAKELELELELADSVEALLVGICESRARLVARAAPFFACCPAFLASFSWAVSLLLPLPLSLPLPSFPPVSSVLSENKKKKKKKKKKEKEEKERKLSGNQNKQKKEEGVPSTSTREITVPG